MTNYICLANLSINELVINFGILRRQYLKTLLRIELEDLATVKVTLSLSSKPLQSWVSKKSPNLARSQGSSEEYKVYLFELDNFFMWLKRALFYRH